MRRWKFFSGVLVFLPLVTGLGPAGPQIVTSMIEAHGGMQRWSSAPAVSFEAEFLQPGQSSAPAARVVVEQARRRAYLDFPSLTSRMAWDGEKAWSENWKLPFPPRFLALLDYYFANIPWLTQDPGVRLEESGSAKLPGETVEYRTVRMSFGPEVGDTPGDYYLLFIHPETKRLRACEYIVTYASILPPGAKATPPNLLLYEEHATVEGLVVPVRAEIFRKEGHVPTATLRFRDWSFSKPFDASKLAMPPGAVVDQSKP
jgi:hypothetical protein